jgi:hypothetical protein
MHLGHDHDHHHHGAAGTGHNSNGHVAQWQTPHLPEGHHHDHAHDHGEPDLDLVETAFLAAFPAAPDPTSFLRLAGVPFTGKAVDGRTLSLLRVEANQTTDVGTLTPHLGGGSHRYDPLPAKMTSRRATLAFVYFDGAAPVRLSLAEAKALAELP